MAKAKGYQGIVGFRKATTWGTAVACGALDGLEVLAVEVEANRGIIPRPTITGRVSRIEGDKGNIEVGGPIRLPLRYESCGRLIAGLFGTAGVPATVDTTGRAHTFKISDNADGIFWTLAYEILKDALIYEFSTVKIQSLTVRWQIPGEVILEVQAIGHNWTDASAVNTTTTIDTITLSANQEIAQARQVVVRINGQATGALGATDVRYCTAGEVTISRPLERDFTTEHGYLSSEPQPPQGDAALLTVSGSLTFSQFDSQTTGGNSALALAQINRDLQKMDWVLTGDGLAGSATEKYSHKLYFPMVVFGAGKPKLSAGALGWQLPFESNHVTAAPTGFVAGHVDACTWMNTNKFATDILA